MPTHIFCYFSIEIYLNLENVMPIVTKFVPQYLAIVMQTTETFNKKIVGFRLTMAKTLFQE